MVYFVTKNGNAIAPWGISLIYRYGQGVVEQSDKEANKWLKLSAEMGYCGAQFELGHNMGSGENGFIKDYVLAYKWLNLSLAILNDRKSSTGCGEVIVRNYIESLMTREQIAEGQRLAREWIENH